MQSEVTRIGPTPVHRWRTGINPYPHSGPVVSDPTLGTYSSDLLYSQSNPGWRSRLGGGSAVGGRFHVVKRDYEEYSTLGTGPIHFSENTNPHSGGWHAYCVQRARFANFSNTTFPVVSVTPTAELLAIGRRAISVMAPTKSSFDGAAFIGELRQGLPRAVGFAHTGEQRARVAQRAGSEYLNVEFGWKPLVSDAKSFAKTVKDADRIWNDYAKGSGKLQIRRFSLPTERTTSISGPETRQSVPGLSSPLLSNLTGNGTMVTTTTTTREVWVEAAFKYYVPESGLARYLSKANKLYGTNLDPATLWELAPWSWAIDWVSDAGVLAENISLFATDNLVMPYCYVMEKKTISVQYQWTGDVFNTYPGSHILRQTFTTTSKRREVGSPYGFHVGWDDFSNRQLAILAAVGITRRRHD